MTMASSSEVTMIGDRIDFISAYCDRWCERCAYTTRCSAFASEVAIAMCGDLAEGLELAVGRARSVKGERSSATAEWVSEMNEEPSAEAMATMMDEEGRRDARADSSPIMTLARACAMVSQRWLEAHSEETPGTRDPLLAEALAIIAHDSVFISAKLWRALRGHISDEDGEGDEVDPIQNDSNGSAKVALISIERSEHAWRTIALATGQETPATLAEQMHALAGKVETEFPRARAFVRPGFDEPDR
jgi:hypothetical protein